MCPSLPPRRGGAAQEDPCRSASTPGRTGSAGVELTGRAAPGSRRGAVAHARAGGGRGTGVVRLLCSSVDPPLLVLADGGSGPTLADRMLGDGPAAAEAALAEAAAAAVLARDLPRLGITVPVPAVEELRGVAASLDVSAPGSAGALVPGDTCPSNALEADGGIVLLDFEAAEHRHIAWEAAYLLVPWPSCWCSWRLPAEVTARALQAWQ